MTIVIDVVVWFAAAACSAGALRQWNAARGRSWAEAPRWLALAMSAVATCAGLCTTSGNLWLSRWTATPNIAEPLARVALLVAVFAGVSLVQRLLSDRGQPIAKGWAACITGASVAVCVTFTVAPRSSSLRVIGGGDADGWSATYTVAWLLPLAAGLWLILAETRHHRAAPSSARRALTLVGAGCTTGLGYLAVKVTTTVGSLLEPTSTWPYRTQLLLGPLLGATAGLLVLAGCLAPRLEGVARRLDRLAWAHVQNARLRQLWHASVSAFPEVQLFPDDGKIVEYLTPWHAHRRLYRRVVEIRDVQLHLARLAADAVNPPQVPAALVMALLDDSIPPGTPAGRGFIDWHRDELRWCLAAAARYREAPAIREVATGSATELEEVQ